MPFATTCDNTQKRTVNVQPQSPGGAPAAIDGPLRVTVLSGDGSVDAASITNNSFKAVSGTSVFDPLVPGDAGVTVFLVEGDADLTSGEALFSDQVTLTVTAPGAASFGFSDGGVEPK